MASVNETDIVDIADNYILKFMKLHDAVFVRAQHYHYFSIVLSVWLYLRKYVELPFNCTQTTNFVCYILSNFYPVEYLCSDNGLKQKVARQYTCPLPGCDSHLV